MRTSGAVVEPKIRHVAVVADSDLDQSDVHCAAASKEIGLGRLVFGRCALAILFQHGEMRAKRLG